MLGDLGGADVIKVEGPPEGDLLRQVQPSRNKLMGAAFLGGANRNKRSVVLDLKTQTGRDQLRKLLIDADVMISSIRPAALARLSLDPETLRQENPNLIMVSATGFGQDGPYAAKLHSTIPSSRCRDWPAWQPCATLGGYRPLMPPRQFSPTSLAGGSPPPMP